MMRGGGRGGGPGVTGANKIPIGGPQAYMRGGGMMGGGMGRGEGQVSSAPDSQSTVTAAPFQSSMRGGGMMGGLGRGGSQMGSAPAPQPTVTNAPFQGRGGGMAGRGGMVGRGGGSVPVVAGTHTSQQNGQQQAQVPMDVGAPKSGAYIADQFKQQVAKHIEGNVPQQPQISNLTIPQTPLTPRSASNFPSGIPKPPKTPTKLTASSILAKAAPKAPPVETTQPTEVTYAPFGGGSSTAASIPPYQPPPQIQSDSSVQLTARGGLGSGFTKPQFTNNAPQVQNVIPPPTGAGLGSGFGFSKPQTVVTQPSLGGGLGSGFAKPEITNAISGGGNPASSQFQSSLNPQAQAFTPSATTTIQETPAPDQQKERFIPKARTIAEIHGEDTSHSDNYRKVADDDEIISYSGGARPDLAHPLIEKWSDYPFDERLIKLIEQAGYARPRRIQGAVIPLVLDGDDIKAQSETGSGKTAAFLIPIVQKMLTGVQFPRDRKTKPQPIAIILEPTRELCEQVYDQARKFTDGTGIKVCRVYGNYSMGANLNEINRGCDILCITPGRFKHFVTNQIFTLEELKYLVLDEADRLFEEGFWDVVNAALRNESFPTTEKRQTLLFSATFPTQVDHIAAEVLKPGSIFITNKKPLAANQRVHQTIIEVSGPAMKCEKICEHFSSLNKSNDQEHPRVPQTLVFTQTKRDCDKLGLYLNSRSFKATTVHGDRKQSERETAINEFRTGNVDILVATDVCARGIDIKNLDHVFNYDLPRDFITYIHRIGRTGRIRVGWATSFYDTTSSNDQYLGIELTRILADAKQEIPSFLAQYNTNQMVPVPTEAQPAPTSFGWGSAQQAAPSQMASNQMTASTQPTNASGGWGTQSQAASTQMAPSTQPTNASGGWGTQSQSAQNQMAPSAQPSSASTGWAATATPQTAPGQLGSGWGEKSSGW